MPHLSVRHFLFWPRKNPARKINPAFTICLTKCDHQEEGDLTNDRGRSRKNSSPGTNADGKDRRPAQHPPHHSRVLEGVAGDFGALPGSYARASNPGCQSLTTRRFLIRFDLQQFQEIGLGKVIALRSHRTPSHIAEQVAFAHETLSSRRSDHDL